MAKRPKTEDEAKAREASGASEDEAAETEAASADPASDHRADAEADADGQSADTAPEDAAPDTPDTGERDPASIDDVPPKKEETTESAEAGATADPGAGDPAPLTAEDPLPGSESVDPDIVADGSAGSAPEAPAATEIASPPPPPAPAEPSERRGMSVLLGGVIAALLGAAVMYFAASNDWLTLGGPDEALLARIDALEAELAEAGSALDAAASELAVLREAEPDLSEVLAAIETVASEAQAAADANAGDIAALTEALTATDERLQKVAVQQIPEAELPQAISDAYDAKLADLLGSIDERFAALQAGLDAKITEMESTQAAAAEAEAAAQAAARASEARAAFAGIRTSLEDGTPYAEEVATLRELTDLEVPEALAAPAQEGVPTIEELAAAFPALARVALTAASARAVEDGELSRWQAFLRTQAGARSLAPREGDDPDAVLSRAENAARQGDLDAALSELDALPAGGREAMADWVAMAETRRGALQAADALAAELEQD